MAAAPRVLLVDDDRRMLGVLVHLLGDDGFDVTAVSTGPAAREAIDGDPAIGVAVIDYKLPAPDTDGIELGAALHAMRPELEVIVFSSLLDRALEHEARARGFLFLDKLRGLDALSSILRSIVDPGESRTTPNA